MKGKILHWEFFHKFFVFCRMVAMSVWVLGRVSYFSTPPLEVANNNTSRNENSPVLLPLRCFKCFLFDLGSIQAYSFESCFIRYLTLTKLVLLDCCFGLISANYKRI